MKTHFTWTVTPDGGIDEEPQQVRASSAEEAAELWANDRGHDVDCPLVHVTLLNGPPVTFELSARVKWRAKRIPHREIA